MTAIKGNWEGEIVPPTYHNNVTIRIMGTTVSVPAHMLSPEQKDELTKYYREFLDSAQTTTYRAPASQLR